MSESGVLAYVSDVGKRISKSLNGPTLEEKIALTKKQQNRSKRLAEVGISNESKTLEILTRRAGDLMKKKKHAEAEQVCMEIAKLKISISRNNRIVTRANKIIHSVDTVKKQREDAIALRRANILMGSLNNAIKPETMNALAMRANENLEKIELKSQILDEAFEEPEDSNVGELAKEIYEKMIEEQAMQIGEMMPHIPNSPNNTNSIANNTSQIHK